MSWTRYATLNAAALALTIVATQQGWVGATGEVPASIVRKYLPFALFAASLATALVAWRLPLARRPRFLARHFGLYAAAPLLLFVLSRNVEPAQAVLGAIYLGAIGLWTLHALEGLAHVIANLEDRIAARTLAAVMLVPFLSLMPYERAVMPTASDEPHYLVIVQSLIDRHSLDLTATYDDPRIYQPYYPDVLPDRHIIQVGDAQYPIRDLGLPLLAVLPFAVAGRSGVLVLLCLVGAALVAQLYLACRDLRIAYRPALLGVAGASLTHPLLTYTTQIYPELLAALAFVLAARLLRRGRAASLGELAGASACVGVLPWLSTRAWLIAIGVGLVVAYCAIRPIERPTVAALGRRVAAGAGPFALLVLALATLDYRMFGVFIPNAGYYLIRDQQQVLAFAPQIGGLGLLFDKVFGLIPRTPLFLLSALGVIPLLRRARGSELAALGLGWLVYFVYVADVAYWWADGSPPSRYLVASLPFLAVLLAAGIERIDQLGRWRPIAEFAAWALAAYSLFIAYVFAVLPNLRYDLALEIRSSGSDGQLFEFLGRVLRPDPAIAFPSLVHARPSDLLLGVAWLAIVLVLGALGAGRAAPET
ncbi:MAG: hypothetical protein AUH85_10785 [Chloroflexi bacterium 13_1_40CM_4_68_4]|nr:MAG: hypothetical protein AUH85_10785 [Chloroflexi bacterium 13_1_40CM_4_68_4]